MTATTTFDTDITSDDVKAQSEKLRSPHAAVAKIPIFAEMQLSASNACRVNQPLDTFQLTLHVTIRVHSYDVIFVAKIWFTLASLTTSLVDTRPIICTVKM